MSKELNTDKININRELIIKQIIDVIVIFITMCIIFCFIHFQGSLDSDIELELGIILGAALLGISLIFYIEKNLIKRRLDKIISLSNEITGKEIANVQDKNNFQKENNSISSGKIENIKIYAKSS